jgi:ribosome maturation factor RimP
MKIDVLKQKIYELASDIAVHEGFELYDVQIHSGKKSLLKIIIDKDGGITIDDCERMSKSLGALLDVEDLIKTPYMLEVSSPGLDRPLLRQKDFEKNIGRLVRIVTLEKIDNQTFFIGRLSDVGENWIRLTFDKKGKNEDLFIPLEKISKANLEIEF